MKINEPGYNQRKREEIHHEDFYNRWALIERKGNTLAAGKISHINRNGVVLKPYQDFERDREKGEYFISNKDPGYLIERIDITGIKTTTRKNIESYCKYMNREILLDSLRKNKEQLELNHFFNELNKSKNSSE